MKRKSNIGVVVLIAIVLGLIITCQAAGAGSTGSCARTDLETVRTGDACYRLDGTHVLFTVEDN